MRKPISFPARFPKGYIISQNTMDLRSLACNEGGIQVYEENTGLCQRRSVKLIRFRPHSSSEWRSFSPSEGGPYT